ncbi:MAG: class I SAM-dependent methyltransferase [Bacteroidetes bacterium]|nr:MAG: class I SAM-dependent methyltransferase [Bacteroidota bacterium]REK04799.1 MAG: class I SAM-dependent methyltransferase [Bacteroidota bacterium]REK36272.1 MAG: class I SAM-dependent methyltransferase [Bacteroidota bacterium]REK51064.1 MAG: class I SAM-dependent methyltransferase [Bacteroidota bacterium]
MSSHERAHHDEANNVTYQRCQFAYEFAVAYVSGKEVLDVGCGNAYGTALMARHAKKITGLDYDSETIQSNISKYKNIPNLDFIQGEIPPLPFEDKSFEVITSFQFIEHIHARKEFLAECMRVLKPGGKLLLTTPNAVKSLARNPFHVHEYTFPEMHDEIGSLSNSFELKGLNGNETVNTYYRENGKFVRMILRFDVFGLHKKLPSSWLTKPYNWVTSIMRNKLKDQVSATSQISTQDFFLQDQDLENCWDIYLIASK